MKANELFSKTPEDRELVQLKRAHKNEDKRQPSKVSAPQIVAQLTRKRSYSSDEPIERTLDANKKLLMAANDSIQALPTESRHALELGRIRIDKQLEETKHGKLTELAQRIEARQRDLKAVVGPDESCKMTMEYFKMAQDRIDELEELLNSHPYDPFGTFHLWFVSFSCGSVVMIVRAM